MYLEVDIVRALVAHGADVKLGIENGTTPLMAAAGVAVEKIARPPGLVRWNIIDSDPPQIPRDESEVAASSRILLDSGADANQANTAGDTSIHAAAAGAMNGGYQ